jgi:hypothetical protein
MTALSPAEARRQAMLRGETPTPSGRYVEDVFARRPAEAGAWVMFERSDWRIDESGNLEVRFPAGSELSMRLPEERRVGLRTDG